MTTQETRSRHQIYRDNLRGGPPAPPKECGTWAAVMRHYRHDEPLDDACKEAERRHNAEQYQNRKAKRLAAAAAAQEKRDRKNKQVREARAAKRAAAKESGA